MSFVEGKYGKALSLTNTSLQSGNLSGNFKDGMTISCWVKTNTLVDAGILQLYKSGTLTAMGLHLYYPSHSGWKFSLFLNRNQSEFANIYPSNESPIEIGKWYHIVYTVDKNGKVRVWYNGQEGLGDIGSTNTALLNIEDLSVYSIKINSFKDFDGAIDDLKIYDSVLTDSMIQELSK